MSASIPGAAFEWCVLYSTESGLQPLPPGNATGLAGGTNHNGVFGNEELRGALVGAADDGHQTANLLARDEAKSGARRATEHGPVRIVLLAHFPCVFQHEQRARAHLFRDPLGKDVQL